MPFTIPGVRGLLHPDIDKEPQFNAEPPVPNLGLVADTRARIPPPPPPRPASPGPLSDQELANIIFNENRALSGEALDDANVAMAITILRAQDRWGARRTDFAGTAKTTVQRFRPEERALMDRVLRNVATAREMYRLGQDPTNGSQFFNHRPKWDDSRRIPYERQEPQAIYGPLYDAQKRKDQYVTIYRDFTLK